MNAYAILAGAAVAILAIAEALISVQKSQMKKQFLKELDQKDNSKTEDRKESQDKLK